MVTKADLNFVKEFDRRERIRREMIDELRSRVDVHSPQFDKIMTAGGEERDKMAEYAAALDEMFRQTGKAVLDKNGIMTRGMIVRHLMLPGNLFDSKHILDYLVSRFGNNIYISLMSQYTPMPHILENEKAPEELKRTLSSGNYDKLCDYLADLGQTNAFVQEMSSSGSLMIPAFN
jgi:putative pyruvate formate lyase activating enzyme